MNAKTNTKMKIVENAFYEVINHIGSHPAESGGALFGTEDDYVIRRFIPDNNAKTTRVTYTINTDYLNPVIKKLWKEEGLSLLGIVHSHPNGYSSLSGPDMRYFSKLLSGIKRERFYAPIVFSVPDGGFKFFPHVLSADGRNYQTGAIEIVQDEDYSDDIYRALNINATTKAGNKKAKQEDPFLEAFLIAWITGMVISISIIVLSH